MGALPRGLLSVLSCFFLPGMFYIFLKLKNDSIGRATLILRVFDSAWPARMQNINLM